jgi:alpha-tubulin suppressor-like RCC1 family protein
MFTARSIPTMHHRAHLLVSGAAFALLAGCVSDVVIVEHDLRDPPVEAIVTPPVNTVESSWSSPSHYADPVDLSAGDRHVCARGSDQGVYCWGDNHRGQSGDGDLLAPHVRPRRVPCVEGTRAVIAGWVVLSRSAAAANVPSLAIQWSVSR